jgi:hypothetical protein
MALRPRGDHRGIVPHLIQLQQVVDPQRGVVLLDENELPGGPLQTGLSGSFEAPRTTMPGNAHLGVAELQVIENFDRGIVAAIIDDYDFDLGFDNIGERFQDPPHFPRDPLLSITHGQDNREFGDLIHAAILLGLSGSGGKQRGGGGPLCPVSVRLPHRTDSSGPPACRLVRIMPLALLSLVADAERSAQSSRTAQQARLSLPSKPDRRDDD